MCHGVLLKRVSDARSVAEEGRQALFSIAPEALYVELIRSSVKTVCGDHKSTGCGELSIDIAREKRLSYTLVMAVLP
jgi:hypothetical protein